MHPSVMGWVRAKRDEFNLENGNILEVGSLDVNGGVRDIFGKVSYLGVDFRDGPGVDKVMNGHDLKFPDANFDLVISTEMLEHDDEFWLSMSEMGRVLRSGGYLIITARGNGFPEHGYPYDYWRFMPGGFSKLLAIAKCKKIELIQDPYPDHPGLFAIGCREPRVP